MIPLNTHEVGMVRQAELLAEAEQARLARSARVHRTDSPIGAALAALFRRLFRPATPVACPQPIAAAK